MSRSEKKEWGLETLLSVIGFIFELVRTVVAALRKRSGTVDHLRRLLREPELVDKVFDLIVGQPAAEMPAVPSMWSQFLAALIKACNFDSGVNPHITGENFPYYPGDLALKPVEIVSIKEYLKYLGCQQLSTGEVKDHLKSLGFRPARLVEVLFWWLQNPAKQTNCLIAALGSVGNGYVPCLWGDGPCRRFGLNHTSGSWSDIYEFAAVRIAA